MQLLIDLFDQPQALHHQVDRSDSSAIYPLRSLSHLVVNVARLKHGLGLLFPVLWGQALLDSILAVTDNFGVGSAHSKCSFCWFSLFSTNTISTNIYGHFESFRFFKQNNHACYRARACPMASRSPRAMRRRGSAAPGVWTFSRMNPKGIPPQSPRLLAETAKRRELPGVVGRHVPQPRRGCAHWLIQLV